MTIKYASESERAFYERFKNPDDPNAPPGVLRIRTTVSGLERWNERVVEAWNNLPPHLRHSPEMADLYAALRETP